MSKVDEIKLIILKSYNPSKDRIILSNIKNSGSKLTLGYLLEMGTFNKDDDILILTEDTDSIQIRPKAIYKNNKGYYIKSSDKRVYLQDIETIENTINKFKEVINVK